MLGWKKHKLESTRRNINNLRYADGTTLMAESEEELKSLLMKVKEESEKVVLKLNSQKTKIMVSSPITSWKIDRETMETLTEEKTLALWMKSYDKNRHHITKQRHYFANIGPSS